MKTRRISTIAALLTMTVACVKTNVEVSQPENVQGRLSVSVQYDDLVTRAATDYVTSLEDEKSIKKIEVLVFDQATGALNGSQVISGLDEECNFTLPVGNKTVYAVINGPDLSSVTSIEKLGATEDNLASKKMSTSGLILIGHADCIVSKDAEATPVISVKWLVSRVVLHKVTCNLPAQYKKMKIECVYLGNANVIQTFSGSVSRMVNINGRESAEQMPIGQSGITGSCSDYLYREVKKDVAVNGSCDTKYHMYCQPNESDTHTCLYLLATIDENRYYYRVPLNMGLTANSTCSVELTITNLGSPTPPTGDFESGTITARISNEGWTAGDSYVAEF